MFQIQNLSIVKSIKKYLSFPNEKEGVLPFFRFLKTKIFFDFFEIFILIRILLTVKKQSS